MSETVSIRACARMLGISDRTVRRSIKTGHIHLEANGQIDPMKARLIWSAAPAAEGAAEGAAPAAEGAAPAAEGAAEGAAPARGPGSNKTNTKNKNQLNVDVVKQIDIVNYISRHVQDLKRVGREYEACCPFHEEKTPSFKVDQEKGVWKCFGCGSGGDIIDFVQKIHQTDFLGAVDVISRQYGMESVTPKHERSERKTGRKTSKITTGLPHPEQAPPPPVVHPSMGSYTGRWEYRDKNGILVEYRYRFDLPEKKIVLPLSWCRNETTGKESWEWKQAIAPRPLYRLHDILSRPDAPILIVEGEKPADAAAQIFPEYAVTTSSGGCNAADSSDWSPMAGRCVVIWPDNDQPGNQYAEKVKLLVRKASEIRIVQVPADFPEKWDLADPLPDGWTLDQVRALLEKAESVKPDQTDAPKDDWLDQMIRSRNGIVANVANVLTAMRNAKEWKDVFGFNTFAWRVELIKPPPWWEGGVWRQQELKDEHLTFAAEWLQRREINCSSTLVHEAAYAVAMDRTFHPVQDFLSSLQWDGMGSKE